MTRNRHKKPSLVVENSEDQLRKFEEVMADKLPKEAEEHHTLPDGTREDAKRIVKIRYKPIAWGFCLDEVIFTKWFVNMLRYTMMPWDTYITAQSTYLPEARNMVHRDFLRTGMDYLMMLDSDVLAPPGFLDILIGHKLPMVGGWYRRKGEPYQPCVYDYDRYDEKENKHKYFERTEPGKGLEKVDAAGAGCWLMSREVAVAIGENPYNTIQGGEDLELCRKVKAAGFDLWINWNVSCAHAGVGVA